MNQPAQATFGTRPTSTLIQLTGHYLERVPGGMCVGVPLMRLELDNGTTVEMPVPHLQIGNGLAIAPCAQADGTTVRLDLAMWAPLHYGEGESRSWPIGVRGQDLAVRVTRAFDADRTTTWHDNREAIQAWLRRWGAATGIEF